MDSLPESDKLRYRYEHMIDRKVPSIVSTYQNQALNRHLGMEAYEQQHIAMDSQIKGEIPLKSCEKEECKPLIKENDLKISSSLDRFKLINSDDGKISFQPLTNNPISLYIISSIFSLLFSFI